MSFPRYESYKPSGVEWLGDIPVHWDSTRLRHIVLSIESGGTPESGDDRNWATPDDEDGTSWVTIADMTRAPLVRMTDRRVSPQGLSSRRLRVFDAGTLLYSIYASIGKVAVLGIPAAINQAILAVDPDTSRIVPRYLQYWLTSLEPHLAQFSTSNTQDNLNAAAVRAFPTVVGPLAEQEAIAAFLDRETAKIDALAAEQERLIELLKEKRQAVISHAVTKGLDPSVPMKDSGVEWLGAVPSHWSVRPIRSAARLESGHTPSRNHPEYWEDCTVPWFSLADVWQIREAGRTIITETKECVSELGLANSAARKLPPGTVMLSRTASVGFSAIMGVEMATTQDFANWVCGPDLKPEFLILVFRSMTGEFRRLMMGSTHNTIYMPDIQAFRCAVPPRQEQDSIVSFVTDEIARLDALAGEAESVVRLLSERRSALISAAVTGQIDVRNAVPVEVA